MGLIRFLFFFFVAMVVFRVIRLALKVYFSQPNGGGQGFQTFYGHGHQGHQGHQQHPHVDSHRRMGETTVTRRPDGYNSRHQDDDDGEYIDYKEVK